MSRQEKIGAVLLGVLLFAGLFHFIYTTMKTPLPTDYGNEDFAGAPLDEGADADLMTEEEMSAQEGNPATTPPVASTSTAAATLPETPAKK
jgi:hypothetical protein